MPACHAASTVACASSSDNSLYKPPSGALPSDNAVTSSDVFPTLRFFTTGFPVIGFIAWMSMRGSNRSNRYGVPRRRICRQAGGANRIERLVSQDEFLMTQRFRFGRSACRDFDGDIEYLAAHFVECPAAFKNPAGIDVHIAGK